MTQLSRYLTSEKVDRRNRAVLEAAVALATEKGFRNFSRRDVAERAGVADGSVNNAFATMDGLHDAVVTEAVSRRILSVLGGALAACHPVATAAPPELKREALAALVAA